MQKIMFIILFFLITSVLMALPEISFEKTTHDFGQFKEEIGKVNVEFKFTNTGDEPLKLERVKAS